MYWQMCLIKYVFVVFFKKLFVISTLSPSGVSAVLVFLSFPSFFLSFAFYP